MSCATPLESAVQRGAVGSRHTRHDLGATQACALEPALELELESDTEPPDTEPEPDGQRSQSPQAQRGGCALEPSVCSHLVVNVPDYDDDQDALTPRRPPVTAGNRRAPQGTRHGARQSGASPIASILPRVFPASPVRVRTRRIPAGDRNVPLLGSLPPAEASAVILLEFALGLLSLSMCRV